MSRKYSKTNRNTTDVFTKLLVFGTPVYTWACLPKKRVVCLHVGTGQWGRTVTVVEFIHMLRCDAEYWKFASGRLIYFPSNKRKYANNTYSGL